MKKVDHLPLTFIMQSKILIMKPVCLFSIFILNRPINSNELQFMFLLDIREKIITLKN